MTLTPTTRRALSSGRSRSSRWPIFSSTAIQPPYSLLKMGHLQSLSAEQGMFDNLVRLAALKRCGGDPQPREAHRAGPGSGPTLRRV
jgi:hypothetical protein